IIFIAFIGFVFFIIAFATRHKTRHIQRKIFRKRMIEEKLIIILTIVVRLIFVGKIIVLPRIGMKEIYRILRGEIKGVLIVLIMSFEFGGIAGQLGFVHSIPCLSGFFVSGHEQKTKVAFLTHFPSG